MRPFLREDDTGKVIWALQQVEMWEKVAPLKNGIFSQITCEFDKEGVIFSGGELQRIALARTFAEDYPVIILDEATSQIDETTEAQIYQRLFQQKQNSTIIVISHHPDKNIGADRRYQVCEHSVLEIGSDWGEKK